MASLDAETHRTVPGLRVPPLVCGSAATQEPGSERALMRAEWLAEMRALASSHCVLTNANVVFDAVVAMAEDPSLIQVLLDKFDRDGEVFDVLLAQALDAVARGHLFKDPVTGAPLTPEPGKKRARYNLANTTRLVLGRDDAKANAFWRTRFAILECVPFEDWPADARAYLLDDARNPLEIAAAQVLGTRGRQHEWSQRQTNVDDSIVATFEEFCVHCGVVYPRDRAGDESGLPECAERQLTEGHRNLYGMGHEVRAKLAMELGAAHGFRTDGALLDEIEAGVEAKRAKNRDRFLAEGLLRVGGKNGIQDARGAIKARLARAHGASAPCPACGGSGKVPRGAKGADVICGEKYVEGGCDGTGLDLSGLKTLSRTDKGAVQFGRDYLEESGDEGLMLLAEYHEDDKVPSYVEWLRGGVGQPLNPSPNSLVESGRVSYDGQFMTLPKDGPLRRAVVARPGHVFCECDYAAGELSTLAQVCVWRVGYSVMGDIINASRDPGILHARFAGHLLGCTAEEIDQRRKAGDKRAADFRQAAKPFNYGCGGAMGPVKIVLANRKRIVGTTLGPDGTEYLGIRFCILLDGAERCGEVMVREWRGRECKPVCLRCVDVAAQVRAEWFGMFPEVGELHRWVGRQEGIEEGRGVMRSYGWGMVRGGLGYSDGCNHLFQNLLAVGAKRALWLLTREMYDERRGSPLFGSRLGMFQHDSTLLEIPNENASAGGVRQAELMREGMRPYCPDIFVGCEPALSRRWDKRAKTIFRDGKLVLWEPEDEEVAA